MQCRIIEVIIPFDTHLEKEVNYIELISHMQYLYNCYAFSIVVVMVGPKVAIPKILDRNYTRFSPIITTLMSFPFKFKKQQS